MFASHKPKGMVWYKCIYFVLVYIDTHQACAPNQYAYNMCFKYRRFNLVPKIDVIAVNVKNKKGGILTYYTTDFLLYNINWKQAAANDRKL